MELLVKIVGEIDAKTGQPPTLNDLMKKFREGKRKVDTARCTQDDSGEGLY